MPTAPNPERNARRKDYWNGCAFLNADTGVKALAYRVEDDRVVCRLKASHYRLMFLPMAAIGPGRPLP